MTTRSRHWADRLVRRPDAARDSSPESCWASPTATGPAWQSATGGRMLRQQRLLGRASAIYAGAHGACPSGYALAYATSVSHGRQPLPPARGSPADRRGHELRETGAASRQGCTEHGCDRLRGFDPGWLHHLDEGRTGPVPRGAGPSALRNRKAKVRRLVEALTPCGG